MCIRDSDTSSGWCGGFQTYTSCNQYDDCSWDYVCVQFHHLYDTMCVNYDYVCTGGTWTSDNGYCEDISFVPGDTNGDGFLNVSDVVLIVQTILSGEYDLFSDYNQDGIINITDVIGIINTILGE